MGPDESEGGSTAADPLWLSEARYRAIVEDQPDLVCRFLGDGTLTFANDAYCRYFGVRREEVIGKPYQPVVHPDDVANVQVLVASLSPANPVVFIENRVFRADGAVRWTEWSNRALYDAEGRLLEFQSAGRDVTARKRADEDVARLAAIVASADLAIYATTLDGIITSWNRAAERTFGYSAAEAIGQPIDFLIPADKAAEAHAVVSRLGRGEMQHLETERLSRDGRRLPIALTLSPITDDRGRAIGISRIARDISERKRAERELQERESRFRLMADQAPVLIWLADTNNQGIYFNQPWIDFTGLPLERQLGDQWLVLIHPDDLDMAGAYCQDHFDRRLPFTMEFRLRHRSGEYRWVQDSGRPVFLPNGAFNGYIGSCVDIEERKRLELAREDTVRRASEARALAEEASRLKDEFLAVVSHELRTPLNAILGWAHMLRDGKVAADAVPRALETIERNARIQAQLVEDLLDVSRIVSGQLALRSEPVDLDAVVRAAVEAVRPAAVSKGIAIHAELAAPPPTIMGDPGRLQQAVWNLLVNAIKFTPRQGRIDVQLRRSADEAVLVVHDTGAGITADALPFIFDRFRQADSRTTRAHGGLGIGLTVVEHVVLAHGGTVRADSRGAGLGATFEIVLPVEAPAAASALPPPSARQPPDLRGRCVLVVDDHPASLEVTREILAQCGAEVTMAVSVSEAVEALRARTPALIIADIGMPEQDGFDLIRLVRSIDAYRRTPAIALTAYAGAPQREAALRAGFDAHIAKPVDPDALRALAAEFCGPPAQPA